MAIRYDVVRDEDGQFQALEKTDLAYEQFRKLPKKEQKKFRPKFIRENVLDSLRCVIRIELTLQELAGSGTVPVGPPVRVAFYVSDVFRNEAGPEDRIIVGYGCRLNSEGKDDGNYHSFGVIYNRPEWAHVTIDWDRGRITILNPEQLFALVA